MNNQNNLQILGLLGSASSALPSSATTQKNGYDELLTPTTVSTSNNSPHNAGPSKGASLFQDQVNAAEMRRIASDERFDTTCVSRTTRRGSTISHASRRSNASFPNAMSSGSIHSSTGSGSGDNAILNEAPARPARRKSNDYEGEGDTATLSGESSSSPLKEFCISSSTRHKQDDGDGHNDEESDFFVALKGVAITTQQEHQEHPFPNGQKGEIKKAHAALEADDPYSDLGISTFDFAFFPEGPGMLNYNQNNPKAHKCHYSTEEAWATGSAQAILGDFLTNIHPDDIPSVTTAIQNLMELCVQWQQQSEALPMDASIPPHTVALRFRMKAPGMSDYRPHELRTRCSVYQERNETTEFLVICDGAFMDVSESTLREEELQKNTAALQREIQYHKSTQESLNEALLDIREAHEKLKQQQEQQHKVPPKNIVQGNSHLDLEGIVEDMTSLKGLIESSKFPQKRWAKEILKSLSAKIEAAANPSDAPDDISEVTWSNIKNA